MAAVPDSVGEHEGEMSIFPALDDIFDNHSVTVFIRNKSTDKFRPLICGVMTVKCSPNFIHSNRLAPPGSLEVLVVYTDDDWPDGVMHEKVEAVLPLFGSGETIPVTTWREVHDPEKRISWTVMTFVKDNASEVP